MAASPSSRTPYSGRTDRTPAVLVVEDEALIRSVISDCLRQCGFSVHEAGNAFEAIGILQDDAAAVDLVFSDIKMPGDMDGLGLAQWIRTNRPGLPVTLTSGDASKSVAARVLCEHESFFQKPYDEVKVAAHIRSLVNASTQERRSAARGRV
jgi:CheY-like chemotaxis protein